MDFDKRYVLTVVRNLLNVHSPTGFTDRAMETAAHYAAQLGFVMERDNKGTGYIRVKGSGGGGSVGVCAHMDTLGLMVRSVTDKGTLALTHIGGIVWPTLDGEYCTVFTRDGRQYTGTILSDVPSGHVFDDAQSKKRDANSMFVRLDEVVKSKACVEKLGIRAGDFICIDTKTVVTDSGFIKSRFLDDKLCVGAIFGLLKYWKDTGLRPVNDVVFVITIYEEVGHGMSVMLEGVTELIGLDMGCVGADLTGTEYDVCICAKDAGGPYDYNLTTKLINLAKDNKLSHAVDVYRNYASDVTCALRSGMPIRGVVMGPGVHASHGMERSHYDGVHNTMKLLALYL